MKVIGYEPIDMINGPGTRVTVFLSGCAHRCKGCYNAASWNPKNGTEWSTEIEDKILADLTSTLIPKQGLSLSGGDPLFPPNNEAVLAFLQRVRKEAPDKDIWMWTGYRVEDLTEAQRAIVSLVDTVVDGKFELELKDPSLLWRGSSNQRIIATDTLV